MARYQQCATCVMVLKLPRLKCDGSLAITLFIFSLHILSIWILLDVLYLEYTPNEP